VLELHCIGASFVRGADYLKRTILTASMICRKFGDDIYGLDH
jgi:hypothetical protein